MPFRKPLLGELIDYSDPLTKGLVGYWLMNEGAGNKVFDLSVNKNTGIINGTAPSWSAGKFGPAISLPATDEYIDTGITTGYGSGPWTWVMWFNITDNATGQMLMSKFDGLFLQNIYLQWQEGGAKLVAGLYDGTDFQEAGHTFNYEDALWHQAVMVVDSTNVSLYTDGVFRRTDTHDNVFTTSASAVDIGRRANGAGDFWVKGMVDIVSIYNRDLSAFEIALLCREPSRFVGRRRRRLVPFAEVATGIVNAAAQADIVTSSLAGFRRLNRPGAGAAAITTSSLAGFRRLNRPGVGAAAITTSSLAGMTKFWNLAGTAAITTSSLAGFRRLDRPGAAQAAINIQTFAGATGGSAAVTLEEIFRYRRFRDAGVFRRRNLKGVY